MPDQLDGMLGTIGLEVETELLPEDADIMGWHNTHDASIEIPVATLRNRHITVAKTPANILLTSKLLGGDRRVAGREFVSSVYFEEEEAEQALRYMFQRLQRYGERTQNRRAGLHVHIGWAYDLNTLKRTVLLTTWLESLLFHLGGMGYEFRGVDNNSAYCRPLTSYGPPVVESNIGTVQMTNVESLLSAKSIKSFWNRFGGIDMFNLPRRYTPQRYMGVNFFSIFLHKTLEYRMFNTTLNMEYAMAVVRLCKELTRFTQSSEKFPDEINSVYEVKEKEVNHNLLSKLGSYVSLSTETQEVLHDILERSPVPILNKVHVHTHVADRFITFDERDLYGIASLFPHVKSCENAGILDIHMLDNALNHAHNMAGGVPDGVGLEDAIRRARIAIQGNRINPVLAHDPDDEPEPDPDDDDFFNELEDDDPDHGENPDDPDNDPGNDGNEPDLEIEH